MRGWRALILTVWELEKEGMKYRDRYRVVHFTAGVLQVVLLLYCTVREQICVLLPVLVLKGEFRDPRDRYKVEPLLLEITAQAKLITMLRWVWIMMEDEFRDPRDRYKVEHLLLNVKALA